MNDPGVDLRFAEKSSGIDACGEKDPVPYLFIIGRNHFQNQLMIGFLRQSLKIRCAIKCNAVWDSEDVTHANGNLLLLLDCYEIKPLELWKKIGVNSDLDPGALPMALFNVTDRFDLNFEKQAIAKQIRGVFYINESPERVSLGISKILNGEMWYSRRMTSEVLLEQQQYRSRTEAAEAMLTVREKEILVAMAEGAANSDIAEDFNLSLHTVKSHIYNIYRKIDVHNRLEATLWAARYL